MKDPLNILLPQTAAIYRVLENAALNNFVLIGGAALALHIGHRRSEGLDFVTTLPKLPSAALTQIKDEMRNQGHTIVRDDDPAVVADYEYAGMDLQYHRQQWIVDGIKVTYFVGEHHHRLILTSPVTGHGFRVATLSELSQLKALLAATRSQSRDRLDLYILERDHGFGLKSWKEAYDKAGFADSQYEIALSRICRRTLPPGDGGYAALTVGAPSVEKIASHFEALRREYEIATARAAFEAGSRRSPS